MPGKTITVTYGHRVAVMCSGRQDRWDAVRAVKRLHFGARIFSHAEDDTELFGDLVQKHDDVTGADLEDEQRFDIPLTARQIETLYIAFEFYRKHPEAPKPKRVKPLSAKKEAKRDGKSEMDECGYDLMVHYENALSTSKQVPPGAPDLRPDAVKRRAAAASRKGTRPKA